MLSRTNLPYPSRRSVPNPRPVNVLQPLCALFAAPVLSFQQLAASFSKTPGLGVPLRDSPCTEAQKCPSVSPLPATLTHSLSRKSFPCHSYANTRDRGATVGLTSNLQSLNSVFATDPSSAPVTPLLATHPKRRGGVGGPARLAPRRRLRSLRRLGLRPNHAPESPAAPANGMKKMSPRRIV